MYSTFLGTIMSTTPPTHANFVQACSVTLTNASSSPITYSIAGSCTNYSSTGLAPAGPYAISGTGTIKEDSRCRLSGRFDIEVDGIGTMRPVRILQARVEDQTRKANINGVGRLDDGGSDIAFVLHFNLTR
jgi:hypothetical protein